jgi:hypothetical protein
MRSGETRRRHHLLPSLQYVTDWISSDEQKGIYLISRQLQRNPMRINGFLARVTTLYEALVPDTDVFDSAAMTPFPFE